MILRGYQQEGLDTLYSWWMKHQSLNDIPVLEYPTGCHAKGTRVVMADGSTKQIEDVIVGDVLIGPDSTPRNVLRKIHGKEQMYRITPLRGGNPFVVNENHILSLMTTNEGKQHRGNVTPGLIESISVKDYLAKSKSWRHLRKLYRSGAIEFNEKADPVFDPWALGALLGDGCIKYGINFTNPDIDVLDEMLNVMRQHGLDFGKGTRCKTKNIPCWHVSFVDDTANCVAPNKVTKILKDLGVFGTVSGTKFIPEEYKTGSIDTRTNVLCGLLDTDGHYDKRCGYDWISKSKNLADDMVFIARSLGITASISECRKYCQTGGGGSYWRVHLSGDLSWLPMRCNRKKADKRNQKKNPSVTGFSIEPVGVDEFFGFTLDGDHLYLTDDFFVHHNSGKSLICAELVRLLFDTWPQDHPRTMVIVPSKELAEQNAEKLKLLLPPHLSVGFYSASIGKKQPDADVIVATIGSVHKAAHLVGNIKCVIVDECHLIRPDGAGMYRAFLNELARYCTFRVVGMTATPFRGNGVWLTDGKDPLFTGIAYRCDIKRLLNEGYLAPLVTPSTVTTRIDTSGIKLVNGDFHIDQLAERVEHYIDGGAIEAMQLAHDRKKWIAFTPTVANAYHLERTLNELGARSAVVCGETPKKERERLIAEFRRGEIRCLVTVLALATGFDVPDVDCILWYRPTRSPVLYVQGSGRGLRIAPGKKDCLWLDFSDTTDRLGPIDAIKGRAAKKEGNAEAPFAVCDECGAIVRPASLLHCPECGTQMREVEEPTHKGASNAFVLTPIEPIWRSVSRVTYSRWPGKDGKPATMRVDYWKGMSRIASEFICVFHSMGWARTKAEQWLKRRFIPICASDAIESINEWGIEEVIYRSDIVKNEKVFLENEYGKEYPDFNILEPTAILLDMRDKYPRIIDYRFEDETVTL